MMLMRTIRQRRFQILLTLGLRIGYSLWLALIWLIIDKWFPLTTKSLWETYYHLTRNSTLIGRAFIDVWLRWDAVHYMNIAAFGYQRVGVGDTVFFPLYPYLVGGLSKITTVNVTLVGIFVSSIATFIALICLYDLVILLFNDAKLAQWSIILLVCYPTAFFLHAPYTDALFIMCSVASILMMVRKKHILAGLIACAAGLIRPQGVLLLIPMAILYFEAYRIDKKIFKLREILAIIITPLGFFTYLIWRSRIGLTGIFQSLDNYSSVRFQNPVTTLIKAIINIIQNPTLSQITELLSIIFFLAVLIWMFTQIEFRKHLAIMLYSAATWLLITSKTTINGSSFQSSNRYVLHIFFAFVGLAFILQGVSEKTRRLILTLSLALGLINSTMYALWVFIG